MQSVARRTADPEVTILIRPRSHTFVEIAHEIISTVILFLLIQEGLLSVTSEIMCTEYFALPRECSGRVLDSRLRGCGFEPYRRHFVVTLSKTH